MTDDDDFDDALSDDKDEDDGVLDRDLDVVDVDALDDDDDDDDDDDEGVVVPTVTLDPVDEEEDDDEDVDVVEDEEDEEDEEESLEVLLGGTGDDAVRGAGVRDGLTKAKVAVADGEFTCRSCFLVKRRAQLADAERLICLDCA